MKNSVLLEATIKTSNIVKKIKYSANEGNFIINNIPIKISNITEYSCTLELQKKYYFNKKIFKIKNKVKIGSSIKILDKNHNVVLILNLLETKIYHF